MDSFALSMALRSGALPLLDYLAQVEARFQAREPSVLAFVPGTVRFDRLRREAEALLARYPDPPARPPLFGLLVGVKDIFHVAGFRTNAGSQLPPDLLQGAQAESVTRLKQAGALVMGKTVTTEFAYFAPGPTRNPRHPDHTPGGSSSGSAAAVGAGVCPLALGTQTIGSISRPAAFCGVVGYKPSYDRISRAGVIPLSPSLDHVGVFAPDVGGATLAAAQLCPDWQATTPTRQPVLGVPAGPYLLRADAAALAQFERVCGHLADTGWQVKRVEAMPDFAEIVARHNLLVAADAAAVHAAWFAQFADRYHAKTAELIGHGQAVSTEAIAAARQGRMTLRHGLVDLMRSAGVDLWLSPSAPGTAPRGLESTGDPVMNLPWTHAGLPTVSVPSGFAENGLPWGLQIAGNWYTDEYLLAWAEPIAAALAQMERN
ncbi:MAG: amidase [Ardenticatenales bacterium]|nr:amidase [Ardenticatenales bacterium]